MHFLQALAAFPSFTAFPSNQAVWGRLQPCSLCHFSPALHSLTPNLPRLLPWHSVLSSPDSPCFPWSWVPSQHLWGIFSLNKLIDIAGGRWTDTQTPFPGNQPENPQVDSHTTIPNPCWSCQPECSPVSKASGILCLRYDVLGSKLLLINLKKKPKKPQPCCFINLRVWDRGEARGGSVNNGLTVPELPELLGSADSPFILLPLRSFLSQTESGTTLCYQPDEAFQENSELGLWNRHLFRSLFF